MPLAGCLVVRRKALKQCFHLGSSFIFHLSHVHLSWFILASHSRLKRLPFSDVNNLSLLRVCVFPFDIQFPLFQYFEMEAFTRHLALKARRNVTSGFCFLSCVSFYVEGLRRKACEQNGRQEIGGLNSRLSFRGLPLQ